MDRLELRRARELADTDSATFEAALVPARVQDGVDALRAMFPFGSYCVYMSFTQKYVVLILHAPTHDEIEGIAHKEPGDIVLDATKFTYFRSNLAWQEYQAPRDCVVVLDAIRAWYDAVLHRRFKASL